ncbi:MAG TPA: RhuM family protein [Ignavibacteriaceae bacterium]|nr:RhuM family protein [Ignavibacteriaceae bacterium]
MKEKKPQAEIILFRTEDEKLRLSVLFEDETVWLTQEQMAALFEKGRTTITEHIRNIFEEGELDEKVVCRKFRHTTQHGAIKGKTQTVSVKYYNLDIIISVGYRVKSLQGTQFRQWATQRLRDYIIKGFAMDDERLKELGGGNYWKVLKHRLAKEGNESVTNCNQLKMQSEDGKFYLTDVTDTEQLFRLIQSVSSPKAEPFKLWLAQVATERLDDGVYYA